MAKDIRNMTQKDLREHISYVPQKAWLFSGTIADNLRHGNDRATEQQMKHALSVAQSEFIYDLPDGLYSHVSQGGTNFSGGQKQRLSIARALAKKADLYIFDDSFSALTLRLTRRCEKPLQMK
ncbi:MAG: ATP-binding cassette domain-containing protein [Enterocloster clostridioformis]